MRFFSNFYFSFSDLLVIKKLKDDCNQSRVSSVDRDTQFKCLRLVNVTLKKNNAAVT